MWVGVHVALEVHMNDTIPGCTSECSPSAMHRFQWCVHLDVWLELDCCECFTVLYYWIIKPSVQCGKRENAGLVIQFFFPYIFFKKKLAEATTDQGNDGCKLMQKKMCKRVEVTRVLWTVSHPWISSFISKTEFMRIWRSSNKYKRHGILQITVYGNFNTTSWYKPHGWK